MSQAVTPSTPHLYSGLGELGPLGQLLPSVDVGVVRPLKGLLQLLQLLGREGGATAPLLPLQGQVGLRLHIRALVCAITWATVEERKGGRRGEERRGEERRGGTGREAGRVKVITGNENTICFGSSFYVVQHCR